MTANPIPDEAVEAAAIALDENTDWVSDLAMIQVILAAAAPHIAAQATADLRAGIEALAGEWRASSAEHDERSLNTPPGSPASIANAVLSGLFKTNAGALDALVGGA